MGKLQKDQYLSLLKSCEDNCNKPYCFFKIFLETQHPDPRILCQFKCIEIFKWEESEREKFDIGFSEAGMRWVTLGWASAFAEVYEEGVALREIYRRTKSFLELMSSVNNANANIISTSKETSQTITSEF
jgi:hypothetical protein